MSRDIRGAYAR